MTSTTGSRIYVVERYTGRSGNIDHWTSVRVVESLKSALKLAREGAANRFPTRIAEFTFNRIAGTFYDHRKG